MYRWYEHCEVYTTRCAVGQRLTLPAVKQGERESAAAFWTRVERAGLLVKALALYDQLVAERAAVRRETKKAFDQRMQREGRQTEAERLRVELLASGLTRREVQAELVKRMQPLDGGKTRACTTPDPWQAGRLFRRKADQKRLLEEARDQDDEDFEDEDDDSYEGAAVAEAGWRVACARRRREERAALVAARRRAWALAAAAPE
jgi:hypothetical protein